MQLVGIYILLILLSPGLGCHMLTPLRDRHPRRSIPSQERPLLATSRTSSASSPCATSVCPVPTVPVSRPCVQCQRRIPDACALTRHAPVHMPVHLRPYVPVKPGESALIPFYNVPLPRGQARLHLVAYLGHRLPSQTNTSLFCALCPHPCAPGKIFRSVTHPQIAPGQARKLLQVKHA